jgi:integrase/recombinase XerD
MATSSTPASRSLEEYLQWLTVEKGRSRATTDAYRRDLTRLIDWMDERDLDVSALDAHDLEAYFDLLRGPRAPGTVARAVSSVRGWLGFLVDEGQLDQDPSSRLRSPRRGRSLPKPLSEEEMARMLDGVSGTEPIDRRDRALLELLYGTGARVSEVVGLSLEDLDFDEELILVTGKGSRQRLVPMGSGLRAALMRYLEPGGRRELEGESRTNRLFLNARGGALTRQGVDLVVRRRALTASIPRARVSAHVFRHSCATHMLAHGADIRVVQELLGHASIATTQIYTAVSIGSLQREYRQAHPRAHE